MPDPQTPNLGLYVPLNGADVGTWDVPMNANWNLLDVVMAANTAVALSNVPVTLSPAQYNVNMITFSGTLTANVSVIFPTAVKRSWLVQNNCTANTTFNIFCTLFPTFGFVAIPPGEIVTIVNDGTNIKFVGLGRVGTYWDFAGSAVPNWVTGSNPPPYLNCDGSTFSSSTYPTLTAYLGSTTLPDLRGRTRYTMNQGTGRLTAIDGNTFGTAGGANNILQGHLPNVNFTVTDPQHQHLENLQLTGVTAGVDFLGAVSGPPFTILTQFAATGITVNSGGSGTAYIPPSIVGGLTLVRAG